MDALETGRPLTFLLEICRQLGEASLGVADKDVKCVAEDRAVEHSGAC